MYVLERHYFSKQRTCMTFKVSCMGKESIQIFVSPFPQHHLFNFFQISLREFLSLYYSNSVLLAWCLICYGAIRQGCLGWGERRLSRNSGNRWMVGRSRSESARKAAAAVAAVANRIFACLSWRSLQRLFLQAGFAAGNINLPSDQGLINIQSITFN